VEGLDERSAHVCFYISSLAIEWQYSRIKERKRRTAAPQKSRASLSGKCFCSLRRGVSLWRDFLSLSRSLSFP
jgi:hypothetical protein